MWHTMESRGVSAIIFDFDNTLVDTAGAGRIAIQKVNEWMIKKVKNTLKSCWQYYGIAIDIHLVSLYNLTYFEA